MEGDQLICHCACVYLVILQEGRYVDLDSKLITEWTVQVQACLAIQILALLFLKDNGTSDKGE